MKHSYNDADSPIIWSAELQQSTRATLERIDVFSDGYVHLKNKMGAFGKISLANLLQHRLLIESKEMGLVWEFRSIDELISAGWAID